MTQKEWLDLVRTLPPGLRSDWDGTNHYELQTAEEPFWLDVAEGVGHSQTEQGQRLGLVLDIVAETKEHALDLEGKLQDVRETLRMVECKFSVPKLVRDVVSMTLERIGRE